MNNTKTMNITNTRQLVLGGLFTALIAIGAFIQVPVPYMDYFTLQFLFVLLAGMMLGSVMGGASVGAYVIIGLAGIPIFAAGGGLGYIVRPSFGYLIGFIVTAFVVGLLSEKITQPSIAKMFLIGMVGLIITYGIGFTYKYLILSYYLGQPTPIWTIIVAAFPLDIPGDIFLTVVASILSTRLKRVLKA